MAQTIEYPKVEEKPMITATTTAAATDTTTTAGAATTMTSSSSATNKNTTNKIMGNETEDGTISSSRTLETVPSSQDYDNAIHGQKERITRQQHANITTIKSAIVYPQTNNNGGAAPSPILEQDRRAAAVAAAPTMTTTKLLGSSSENDNDPVVKEYPLSLDTDDEGGDSTTNHDMDPKEEEEAEADPESTKRKIIKHSSCSSLSSVSSSESVVMSEHDDDDPTTAIGNNNTIEDHDNNNAYPHDTNAAIANKLNNLSRFRKKCHQQKQQQYQQHYPHPEQQQQPKEDSCFEVQYAVTKFLKKISKQCVGKGYYDPDNDTFATWIGFWALLIVTCANHVLTPMRDAIALAVGVQHIPKLTLASTLLAFCSSVPIGWLFEAPDPERRKVLKRMGITRGETQGTSLALFYRFFALSLCSYAIGFKAIAYFASKTTTSAISAYIEERYPLLIHVEWIIINMGHSIYIAFFLVVHLMKLHSLSLVWGVITEAIEYEEVARKRKFDKLKAMRYTSPSSPGSSSSSSPPTTLPPTKTRLQRLAKVGFGGTLGGILGSFFASTLANILKMSGLLVLSAIMLEVSAQLSIELGRIMQRHWLEQQKLKQSTQDLASVDPSMRRSTSVGSMKRVASGNSLSRVRSSTELQKSSSKVSLQGLSKQQQQQQQQQQIEEENARARKEQAQRASEDTFTERLLRGVRTILRSRLLMSIFTYNALYASTTVLLSFERAVLVATRNDANGGSTAEADTRFLANINMASSVAVFVLQGTGFGAMVAQKCGSTKTLSLMPLFRLAGVLALAWWHRWSNGQPPNLMLFLILDECTRVMNLAVAKPVRESLWRGLSNEARYEAKPIVDTLANRWGGGSAAFFVSTINKILQMLNVNVGADGNRNIFGLPPVLFLCIIVAAWWAGVSADLGQIRKRIDMELKKVQ